MLAAGAAALLVVGRAVAPTARAQEGEAGLGFMGGHSPPMGPRCRSIGWHVQPVSRTLPASITGVAYYSDMSGLSTIKRTVAADATINATVTPVSGNGPSGTVTGKRGKGATDIVLTGPGCANAHMHLSHYSRNGSPGGF